MEFLGPYLGDMFYAVKDHGGTIPIAMAEFKNVTVRFKLCQDLCKDGNDRLYFLPSDKLFKNRYKLVCCWARVVE